jgi:S-adenosylmethionine-diacylgycerolhomoserine-N-methlytransferase
MLLSPLLRALARLVPARWKTELRVLYHIVCHRVRGTTHKERLDSFYGAQADGYDAFRRRLLKGREQLMDAVGSRAQGGIWVDMGGGTGANLDMAGDEVVMSFARIYIVDLCSPLLQKARERCAERGWHHVEIVEADATTWVPDEGLGRIDLVTFSYSLTMIPDWFVAVDHAIELLEPTGLLGVVDFYVARKYAGSRDGAARHSYVQRSLWPYYFAHDDVHLSPDHLPYLRAKTDVIEIVEASAGLPYLRFVLPPVPYYVLVGTPTVQASGASKE